MRARRPIPLAALVLMSIVVGSAAFGLAYTYWTDSLQINAGVQTGNLQSQWDGGICKEFIGWPLLPPTVGTLEGEAGGVDVGSVAYSIDGSDPSLFHVTITNGYPGYAVTCDPQYVNTGSIPYVARGRGIQATSANLTNCNPTGNSQETIWTCDQIIVRFITSNLGVVIENGAATTNRLAIYIREGASQIQTYTFTAKICVSQFNVSQTGAQCSPLTPWPPQP